MCNQLIGTFSNVEVCEQMANFDANKSTGYDNIPPKIVQMCRDKIAVSFMSLINNCINDCHFSFDMKRAEIVPIFKKDNLCLKNYRPVSVLPVISKTFERLLVSQLGDLIDAVFDDLLSTYRKNV